jgi:hypothetical protein
MKRFVTCVGVLLTGLVLAGCGAGDPLTGRAASDLPPGPLQPVPSDSSKPPAVCKTLDVTVGGSEHAAGSEYVRLKFTNASDDPCFVRGYPTLTLKDASNHQVGETARSYVSGGARDLVLDPDETVTADIRFPNPDNFDPGVCTTGTAAIEVLIPAATERVRIDDHHAYCPGWSVSALHRGSS